MKRLKTGIGNRLATDGRLPHTSLYCTSAVLKALKQIAVERDCKVHDLLVEGLRTVMAKYGRDYDLLSKRQ